MRLALLLLLLPSILFAAHTPVTFTCGVGGTYTTITAAMAASKPGDTIILLPGSYTVTYGAASTYIKNGVTIKGETATRSLYTVSPSDTTKACFVADSLAYLRNFTLTTPVRQQGGYGLVYQTGIYSKLHMTNLWFNNVKTKASYPCYYATNALRSRVYGCRFTNSRAFYNSTNVPRVMQVDIGEAGDFLFNNNIIDGTKSHGMSVYVTSTSPALPDSVSCNADLFVNTRAIGVGTHGSAYSVTVLPDTNEVCEIYINRNTFVNCEAAGATNPQTIRISSGGAHGTSTISKVSYCIFAYADSTKPLHANLSYAPDSLTHSLVVGMKTGGVTGSLGAADIVSDLNPLFATTNLDSTRAYMPTLYRPMDGSSPRRCVGGGYMGYKRPTQTNLKFPSYLTLSDVTKDIFSHADTTLCDVLPSSALHWDVIVPNGSFTKAWMVKSWGASGVTGLWVKVSPCSGASTTEPIFFPDDQPLDFINVPVDTLWIHGAGTDATVVNYQATILQD